MSHWRCFLDPDARGGRFLPWKEVARVTGLSRTTAWRLQKRDDFPAPYVISPGRVAYREAEVEAWRASRDTRSHSSGSKVGHATAPPYGSESAEPSPPPPCQPSAELNCVTREVKTRPRRSEHARDIAQQMLFDF